MEEKDLALIEKYSPEDDKLRKHVEAHRKYDEILEGFKTRVYLAYEEEVEQKRLKKLKLIERDKIERILEEYRKRESTRH